MAEIIRINNDMEVVSIDIVVEYPLPWQYSYRDKGRDYDGNYMNTPPYHHALEFARNLSMAEDYWSFRLFNTSQAAVNYALKIIWWQGDIANGQAAKRHEWTLAGKVDPGGITATPDPMDKGLYIFMP